MLSTTAQYSNILYMSPNEDMNKTVHFHWLPEKKWNKLPLDKCMSQLVSPTVIYWRTERYIKKIVSAQHIVRIFFFLSLLTRIGDELKRPGPFPNTCCVTYRPCLSRVWGRSHIFPLNFFFLTSTNTKESLTSTPRITSLCLYVKKSSTNTHTPLFYAFICRIIFAFSYKFSLWNSIRF